MNSMTMNQCPEQLDYHDLLVVRWYGGVCYVYRAQYESGAQRLLLYRRSGLSVTRHLQSMNRWLSSQASFILRENIEGVA